MYVHKTVAGSTILVSEGDIVYYYRETKSVPFNPPLLKFYLDKELKKDLIAEVYMRTEKYPRPYKDMYYSMLKFYKHEKGNYVEESINFGGGKTYSQEERTLIRVPYFGDCNPRSCGLAAIFIEDEGENWLSLYLTVKKSATESEDVKVYFSKSELLKYKFKKLPTFDEIYNKSNYSLYEYEEFIKNLKKIIKERDSKALVKLIKKCGHYERLGPTKLEEVKEFYSIMADEVSDVSSSLFEFLEKVFVEGNDYFKLYYRLSDLQKKPPINTLRRYFGVKRKLSGYNYFEFLLYYNDYRNGCFVFREEEQLQLHISEDTSPIMEIDEFIQQFEPKK
ncbi:hypothetical protein M900_2143 [Bacteriovorax sp. Seq25_V]|nr:hypothetical protein M900_2143 [Bacteriovorax sp. Seq25_V]